MLEASGALKKGHFQLSSGLHSDAYVQCALLLREPENVKKVGEALAQPFDGSEVDLVVSPAVGGLVIGYGVAQALGVPFIFTERRKARASRSAGDGEKSASSEMQLRRGFSIPSGARVIVIEDVVTTGGSAAEVASLVTELGGDLVGVGSIIRRGEATDLTRDWQALLEVPAVAYEPHECPQCRAGLAIDTPGSSR